MLYEVITKLIKFTAGKVMPVLKFEMNSFPKFLPNISSNQDGKLGNLLKFDSVVFLLPVLIVGIKVLIIK